MIYCCLEIKIISNVRQWLALYRHSINGNGHYAINSNLLETRDESYLCSPCRAKYLAHSRCSTHIDWKGYLKELGQGKVNSAFISVHISLMPFSCWTIQSSLQLPSWHLIWVGSVLVFCKWTHLVHAWLSDPHYDIYNPRLCLFWDNMVFFL